MRTLALLVALAGAARGEDAPLPAPPRPPSLRFSADAMDYSSATLRLRGNVRVVESTWTLKGSEFWVDTERQTVRAPAPLLVENGVSAIYADAGEFDSRSRSGRLSRADAGHGDWRIHAKAARLEPSGKISYAGADMTSCSFDPDPHYRFHSGRVSVVPKKYLVAYHNIFYLGPVPLFYFPVLFKSLKPRELLPVRFQFGYDRRNGGFAKATWSKAWNPGFYSRLFLDYFGAQGTGMGGELQHRPNDDSRGMLYGYRIRELNSTRRERWAVLGGEYHAFSSSMSFQGRLQAQSDPDFNNDYARSSAFRVTPELINGGALTYRVPAATVRLSYSRRDEALALSHTRFTKAQEETPRLEAQSAQQKWGPLPWLNTLSGFAVNSYDRGRGFQQRQVQAAWEGTRPIPLPRGLSLTPKIGYRQDYLSRLDEPTSFASTTTVLDAMVGRYILEGTLRWRSRLGSWDVTHSYRRRLKRDALSDDAGAVDRGVEANQLTVLDAVRPNSKILIRAFSGYDFRVFRDRDPTYKQRIAPVVGEAYYTPRPSLSFSLRNDWEIARGNRAFLLGGEWGDRDSDFAALALSHNKALPYSYFADLEFSWAPAPFIEDSTGSPWNLSLQGFKFGMALRNEIVSGGGPGRVSSLRLYEKELVVEKKFHDIYARLGARFRPGNVREVSIRLRMSLGRVKAEAAPRKDWESEWFPSRQGPQTDRP